MIVEGGADDIVYTNLFTGVHGNYLRAQRGSGRAGPGQPAGGPTRRAMNFGGDKPKAWKDIWGVRPGHRRGGRTWCRPRSWWRGWRAEYRAARARIGVAA